MNKVFESDIKLSITKLYQEIDTLIDEESNDMKLIKYIQDKFAKKGMQYHIPSQMFQGNQDVENLNSMELICFTEAIYEYLNYERFNPNKYFSKEELISYSVWTPAPEDYPDYTIFHNVRKITSRSYSADITAKQASEMRKHKQYIYNKSVQRPSKKVVRKGRVSSKENLNFEGVEDLQERFIKKNIFPTQIAWAVLYYEGKTLDIKFTPIQVKDSSGKIIAEYKDLGDLKIASNWNENDINYTPLIINDGYHRFTALANAYEKYLSETGEELDTKLTCIINIMSVEEAKQYTQDSFKRNFADEEELKTMAVTDENKFIDNIVAESKILKSNIAPTFKHIKTFNAFTSKDILLKAIKHTTFDYKSEFQSEFQSEKCAKIIDLIIEELCKQYFDNDINKMKETYLLQPNMFIGYLALADLLKNESKYAKKIVKIIEELYIRINEEEINRLKLKNKECNVKMIFEYFHNILEVK